MRRYVEEQILRVEKDALHAEVVRVAGGEKSGEATAIGSTSSPAVPTSELATQRSTSQDFLSRPSLTHRGVPGTSECQVSGVFVVLWLSIRPQGNR